MVQLSHPYMTTVKAIALTRWTFVSKMMFLLFFNMLSRFAIAFLPRSNCLLISWLQSSSTVILEPKKIKSVTASIFPHLFAMKRWNQRPWFYVLECWVFFSLSFTPIKRISIYFCKSRIISHKLNEIYLQLSTGPRLPTASPYGPPSPLCHHIYEWERELFWVLPSMRQANISVDSLMGTVKLCFLNHILNVC